MQAVVSLSRIRVLHLVSFLSHAVLALGTSSSTCRATYPTSFWPGFHHIRHAFVFGDSYSSTGFNPRGAPPSAANPMGNPAYPGATSSNGENWVDLLTTKYNESALETWNFAVGGATVSGSLVRPFRPTVLSLGDQIEGRFLQSFAGRTFAKRDRVPAPFHLDPNPRSLDSLLPGGSPLRTGLLPTAPKWTSRASLFLIWIGINDVHNSYFSGPAVTAPLFQNIFADFDRLVNRLHDAGARHFVFINVPPLDRSPGTVLLGRSMATLEKNAVDAWNAALERFVGGFKNRKSGVNVWIVDADALFTRALDNAASFPQTARYRNTTDFCWEYMLGTPRPDTFFPQCDIPADQYFWLNGLHPTTPIHDVVAQEVARQLRTAPVTCAGLIGQAIQIVTGLLPF